MIIRNATPTDVPTIRQCVEASLEATYGGLWTSEPLRAGDDDWANAWVACSSGAIIGVGLTEADIVSDLWIHPASQGKGAGTALLAALETEIAGRGLTTARLRCLEPNLKARGFYASRGWTEVRVYPHETLPLNTVDFVKTLAPQP
ncbi:GNAT family N-acetyltransferase [Phenylobacterium montanum]|uniref:GNAT family N-acetyltransferase n=1 Tax=Phenylobacterium montanum TaxID=2823693 RepID=A0A975IWK2_9CAUL|nr:GNAT family N-acetyltransferase [Caulobacter sp. S6]QUD89925.1 GNAT family N-acetyltransferase [Caulobacter sp. S6]